MTAPFLVFFAFIYTASFLLFQSQKSLKIFSSQTLFAGELYIHIKSETLQIRKGKEEEEEDEKKKKMKR